MLTSKDLLSNRKPVSVLEDSFGETRLFGAIDKRVFNPDDMLKLIDQAAQFRKTAVTEKNDNSSRSHAICRITIQNAKIPSAPAGLLYLIDLAGSEAARDINGHGADRYKESREINTSLSTLKDCIRGRSAQDIAEPVDPAKRKPYIPFRQSALTKTLKHVFDPEAGRICKTSVIACVNPSFLDSTASKNTLRYADMLRVAVPKPAPLEFNPLVPRSWTNEETKTWIANNVCPPID
jgi:kinesin family protein 2/24